MHRVEFGIAHAEGARVFFSSARHYCVLAKEGGQPDSPEAINANLHDMKEYLGGKPTLVVVEGGVGFMKEYQRALTEPEVVVYCGPEEDLAQLGVAAADAEWRSRGQIASIDDVIAAGATAFIPEARKSFAGRREAQEIWVYDRESGGPAIGRVTSDGKVFDAPLGGACLGMIDHDGVVHDRPEGGHGVGRVDRHGAILEYGPLTPARLGSVDAGGMISDKDSVVIGRVEPPDMRAGAAAGALLFRLA